MLYQLSYIGSSLSSTAGLGPGLFFLDPRAPVIQCRPKSKQPQNQQRSSSQPYIRVENSNRLIRKRRPSQNTQHSIRDQSQHELLLDRHNFQVSRFQSFRVSRDPSARFALKRCNLETLKPFSSSSGAQGRIRTSVPPERDRFTVCWL